MRATGSLDGWNLVKDAWCYKPSGDSGVVTNEDKQQAIDGDEQEVDLETPSFRYVRIHMIENWSGGIIPQISEITFWGQVVK